MCWGCEVRAGRVEPTRPGPWRSRDLTVYLCDDAARDPDVITAVEHAIQQAFGPERIISLHVDWVPAAEAETVPEPPVDDAAMLAMLNAHGYLFRSQDHDARLEDPRLSRLAGYGSVWLWREPDGHIWQQAKESSIWGCVADALEHFFAACEQAGERAQGNLDECPCALHHDHHRQSPPAGCCAGKGWMQDGCPSTPLDEPAKCPDCGHGEDHHHRGFCEIALATGVGCDAKCDGIDPRLTGGKATPRWNLEGS